MTRAFEPYSASPAPAAPDAPAAAREGAAGERGGALTLTPTAWRGECGPYSVSVSLGPDGDYSWGIAEYTLWRGGDSGLPTLDAALDAARVRLAELLAVPPTPERIGAWERTPDTRETWRRECEGYALTVEDRGSRWAWRLMNESTGGWGEAPDGWCDYATTREMAMTKAERVAKAVAGAVRE